MTGSRSLPPEYFEAIYAADPDPWRFESSDYERDKYAETLAALGGRHFSSGFEVGCSIGVLTRSLAARCERLLAVDVADAALERARERCRDLAHVRFARTRVPAEWPVGAFDLIVLSEVLYYLSPDDIGATAASVLSGLSSDGVVLLVHFTEPTNYPVSGDQAVQLFAAAAGNALSAVRCQTHTRYRLDCFVRG